MAESKFLRPLGWLKPAVTTGALVPLAVLGARGYHGTLQSDPVAEILNQFGILALIFLVASLACTPLKLVTGWTWPMRLRKLLGLFSFFYALLHVAWYVGADQIFNLAAIWEDATTRGFIVVGLAAFLLLVPLAATSTNGMIRRLGAKRWQLLHRLAYVAGVLGVIHFIWRVKLDLTEPLIYAGVLAVLLGVRAVVALKARQGPN